MIEESNIHKYRKKGIWLLLVSILLVVGVFFVLDQLQSTHIRETILSADPLLLAVSTLTMSLAFLGMGLRWRALMPVKPPLFPISGIICAGLLLNYATPGPLGEVAAAYFVSKRFPLSFSKALASGVIARMLGLISAAILGASIWIFCPLTIDSDLILPIQLIALFSLSLGLGLLSLLLFPQFWSGLTKPRSDEKKQSKIQQYMFFAQEKMHQFSLDAADLGQSLNSSYVWAIFWSCFSHSAVILSIVLMGMAFHADGSLYGIIFTYAITTAGAVLLFALPGSYIGWDALFLGLLLSTAGMTQTESFAIVGIVRIQQLGYMLLGAISLNWLIKPSFNNP